MLSVTKNLFVMFCLISCLRYEPTNKGLNTEIYTVSIQMNP